MKTHPTPRQRRHHKTKETILLIARQIITEKGLDGLSLRELARRMDYSPSSLYEYFHSKDDLIAAVCKEGMERLNEYLTRIPTHLPPQERLLKMGLAYLEFARQNPEQFRLIFTDLAAPPAALDNVVVEEGDPYHTLLQAVQAAIETSQIVPQPGYGLPEIAYSMWALVHGLAVLEQTQVYHLAADFETIHQHTLETFAAGFKARQLSAKLHVKG